IYFFAWRQTGECVSKNFTNVRMALVSGRLQIRKWQNDQGENRYSTEVVADNVYFGDSKRDGEATASYGSYATPASDFAMMSDDDAQLPF
ncbi:MAG: single-stranded DNA-binding protein, partial [Clostridia bacterium]|nr:single-stranded DNA-binding protein [Clostridia bacterium]